MNRAMRTLLLFVLSFSLTACMQEPALTATLRPPIWTPIVTAGVTLTASPSAVPVPIELTPSPTSLPLPTLPPPTAFVPAASAGKFSPVLYTFSNSDSLLLLGGVQEGRGWLSAENAQAYVGREVEYEFFGAAASTAVQGSALEFSPTCRSYFMKASSTLPERMVGVTRGWISSPRGARDIASDDPAYAQELRAWFESRGTPVTEIHISRILQTDIEGDGVDEVLLSASYFNDPSGHMTERGDFSIVVMRKVVGNTVVTIPLVSDYYVAGVPELSYPNTYTLAAALDLNEDTTLEVIVDARHWEGLGAIVYQVDGQNVREVLRAVC